MGSTIRIALAIALLSLAGCGAGRDFNMPAAGTLQLGVTTPEQAMAMLGAPLSQSSATVGTVANTTPPQSVFVAVPHSGSYQNLNYAYVDTTGQQLVGSLAGVQPARTLRLEFLDGKLVGYLESSSFQNDSTNFDDTKVAQIVRGQTRQNDVTTLLGKPSGEVMYPIISQPEGHAAIYSYAVQNLTTRERSTKFLAIYFDASGTVRDLESNSATNPMPVAPPTGGTAIVPIIIPRGK